MLDRKITIKIQALLDRMGDIPSVFPKKVQENIDAIIKDRNMVASEVLAEKGTGPRGPGASKSDQAVRENSGFEQKKAQTAVFPKMPKIAGGSH